MRHLSPILFTTGALVVLLTSTGCDHERDHHPSGIGEPIADPAAPHKTELQAKVAGAPADGTPADAAHSTPAGHTPVAAPGKPTERNVSGNEKTDAASPTDSDAVFAPGKSAPPSKDATP